RGSTFQTERRFSRRARRARRGTVCTPKCSANKFPLIPDAMTPYRRLLPEFSAYFALFARDPLHLRKVCHQLLAGLLCSALLAGLCNAGAVAAEARRRASTARTSWWWKLTCSDTKASPCRL